MRREFALGGIAGAVAGCAVPVLPGSFVTTMTVTIALAVAVTLAMWRRTSRLAWILVVISGVVFGAGWLWLHAGLALGDRLPASADGQDAALRIEVIGLPEQLERQLRFEARVVSSAGTDAALAPGARLRLSWYQPAPALVAGDRIEAVLRLRRPRGFVNPGGFDFERQALTARIAAVGYVRSGRPVDTARHSGTIDRMRLGIATRIDAAVDDPTQAAVLRALAVGDVRGLRGDDWDVLRVTGTGHLIAISGLHVGLVAAFGAWLFVLLYHVFPGLGLRWPRPQAMAVGALMTASAYALLAGSGVPVVRTLLMIAVALSATLLRRAMHSVDALLVAGVVIVATDPLAVLGAGFWLSFVGVAFLVWAVTGAETSFSGLWRAQVAMGIGLLPIGAWWFAQTSVIGFVANLAAVPWITFVVVPLLLCALLLDAATGITTLYALPAALLQPLWMGLELAARSPLAEWHFARFGLPALLLAVLGGAWMLMPRGVPMRALGLALMLPLLVPASTRIAQGEFEVVSLDVGQGLSVLIRTHEHTLLYDAGATLSDDFDLGDAVVVPTLRALDVRSLDWLMISHLDQDHAGGRAAVLRAWPETRQQVGDEADPSPRCEASQHWNWDGVRFEVLHPPRHFPDLGNEHSCVLRVSSPFGSALLPGDIGAVIEQRLVREQPAMVDVDLVIAAHHGSRHSSTTAFVEATSPDTVVMSRGWRNRFGHPAADVLQRWTSADAIVRDTAIDGAVTVRFGAAGVQVEAEREVRRVFWREHGSDRP